MSIYTSKESLILTLNAMCKMVKNRYRDAFGYYSTIRKELSKQNKAAKLDNELTPEEEKKYISYDELMSVPGKVAKVLNETQPGEYDYTSSSNSFSQVISKLFMKYNGKPMSMNMIRHIAESHLIQSPTFAKLINREKNDLSYSTAPWLLTRATTKSRIDQMHPSKTHQLSRIHPLNQTHRLSLSQYLLQRPLQRLQADLETVGNAYSMEISLLLVATKHLRLRSLKYNLFVIIYKAIMEQKQKRTYRKAGPFHFHMEFDGLQACLRSDKSQVNIKTMLVSHAFVDLWRISEEDKSFDKPLFDLLDEPERDFMKYCLNKCKITSRGFKSAYNQLLDGLVKRLEMLEGAMNIGDDSPLIKTKMKSILDKLYEKGVFSNVIL
ncbi:unnamed protein product [Phytophthora lilii]|uniref:Unnamed protein product n=1 Tax=Phytophthora lilii TaxID=2077276 RepID=A0A9W6X878_9STRA|nr:unnamed protein product [Phytophthora lilii]